MNFLKALTLVMTFVVQTLASEPPSEWEPVSKGSDYALYKKPSTGTKGLVAFRLVGEITHSPRDVAIALMDREHRLSWMRDVRELRTVRIPEVGAVIEYTAVNTPIIIKDRDFVIRTDIVIDRSLQKYVITSKSVIDASVPEGSDIRGNTDGKVILERGKVPGTTQLTVDMDVDPKGSVPLWIVNQFQKNWPIGMFRGLQRFLDKKVAVLPPDLQSLFKN